MKETDKQISTIEPLVSDDYLFEFLMNRVEDSILIILTLVLLLVIESS